MKKKKSNQNQKEGMRLVRIISVVIMIGKNLAFAHMIVPRRTVS